MTADARDELSRVLRAARERHGRSKRELAALMGVDRATIRKAEEGHDTRHSTLQAYLDALPGLSPSAVLTAGRGRLLPPLVEAWRFHRDALGYVVRRLTHAVDLSEPGRVTTTLTLAGVRSLHADPSSVEARRALMRATHVGTSATLSRLLESSDDPAGTSLTISDETTTHEYRFPRSYRRIGFTYTRSETRDADEVPESPIAPLDCLAIGTAITAEHPTELLEIVVRPPTDGREPLLIAWADPLVPAPEARRFGELLCRTNAEVRTGATMLSVRIRHPMMQTCVALGWRAAAETERPAVRKVEERASIAATLRHERERAGLSLRRLADDMGRSPNTLRSVEAGHDVRHSSLSRYLTALPDVSPWDLLSAHAVDGVLDRRATWEYYRDLFGCEADEECKSMRLFAKGSSQILIATRGLRRLRDSPQDFTVRFGFGRAMLRPWRASLDSVQAGRDESPSLRISRVPSPLGAPIHQVAIPSELATSGVNFARRLVTEGVYTMTAERGRATTGVAGPFREGTTFGALVPVRSLRIEVRFPRGLVPEEASAHALARVQLPDATGDELTARLHPEGLHAEIDRRRRTVTLTVGDAVPGFKYALSWLLP